MIERHGNMSKSVNHRDQRLQRVQCFDTNEGCAKKIDSGTFLNRIWNEGKKKSQFVSQTNCEK